MDTPFPQAIGPLASEPGAPPVCSLRTVKSDVVVGIPSGVGEKLDEEEPGWKISGKYVSCCVEDITRVLITDTCRLLSFCRPESLEKSPSSRRICSQSLRIRSSGPRLRF